MKHYSLLMSKLLFRSFLTTLVICITYLGSLGITQPALAPTADIKILGASTSEQEQLNNLVSYDLSEQPTVEILATGYLVMDLSSGQIVLGKQISSPLPIASLTKLITVWTVLKHTSLDEVVTVPQKKFENTSPSIGLIADDKVKVSDLINSILVGSNNDAADVLANYVVNKVNLPFVDLMNQEAVNLGMTNSRFSNPLGFDSTVNYSSAKDLSVLVSELIQTNIFDATYRATQYTFKSQLSRLYMTNATNQLINQYPDLKAVKTGFTPSALGSMINILETPSGDYLIIVIGSPEREKDTLKLRKQLLNVR